MKTLYRSFESNSNLPISAGRRASSLSALFPRIALSLILITSGMLASLSSHAMKPLGETLPTVISAGADHDIKEWNGNGKLVATIGSHDDAVNALLLVDSDILISVGADGACKTWNISDARMTQNFAAVHGSALSVALSPNKMLLAIGTAGGKIDVFYRATGKKIGEEVDAHNDGIRGLRFSADGGTVFSASSDRQMRFWKVTLGSKAPLGFQVNINAHDDTVNALVVSPDDRTIATISADGYLKTWQRNGGELINRVKVCQHGAEAVAFSPDGKTIATGDADGKVRLWNTATFAPISTLGSHERAVTCLAWSPNGKFVVSGGADKTLRYWSLEDGRQAARITAHDGVVTAVVVLP